MVNIGFNRIKLIQSMFEDGKDAGELLAEALNKQNLDIDIVLLTSLESFLIGKKVAKALEVPLNSMLSRELTAPGKKLAFGAVSEKNTIWLDDAAVEEFMIGEKYISKIKEDRIEEMQETLEQLGLDKEPDLQSKNVLLVSESIDSGIREASSLGAALRSGSDSRIIISPFISETGLERMGLADEVICLERSSFPLPSNQLYSSKSKIGKDEIKNYFRA